MFEASIQYYTVANGAGLDFHATQARYAHLQAESHERRRSSVLRTIRTLSDSVLGGLIDGFLAPRIQYSSVGKPV